MEFISPCVCEVSFVVTLPRDFTVLFSFLRSFLSLTLALNENGGVDRVRWVFALALALRRR